MKNSRDVGRPDLKRETFRFTKNRIIDHPPICSGEQNSSAAYLLKRIAGRRYDTESGSDKSRKAFFLKKKNP